jgi:hypothetical protein
MHAARVTSLVSALLLLGSTLLAQSSTGVITGQVVDPAGASVPEAQVVLTHQLTGVKATLKSNAQGDFVFPSVLPGLYSVTIEASGFKKLIRTGITLTASERLALGSITLQIGGVSDSVTVTSEAPPVQSESQERSAVLNDKQMTYLSAQGRDYLNMLKVLPGVTYPDNGGSQALGESGAPIVQGVRGDYMSMNVDGVVANNRGVAYTENMMNLDSIAEVKVLLGNYQAEYGKNAGAVINVITKGGTQEFHGGAYWYKRHEMFNANSFFNNRNRAAKSRYRYNTIGYNIGGPIYIPGKFNTEKDKLFFFFSGENQPNKQPGGFRTYTMPTTAERGGDFSQSYEPNGSQIVVKDPLAAGAQFPGNIIPSSRINAQTQKLLGVFPTPNFLDTTISKRNYNYTIDDVRDNPVNQQVLRVDYNPTSKWRTYFRGMDMTVDQQGRTATANGNAWGIEQGYKTRNPNISFNATYIASPTIVNELSIGMSRWEEQQTITDSELAKLQRDKLGITLGQLNPANNPLKLIPAMSFSGLTGAASVGFDGRFPMENTVKAWSFSDSFTKVFANHTLKAGIYFEIGDYLQSHHGSNFAGNFNFGRNALNPYDSNHPYATALLGYFQTYTEVNTRVEYWPQNKVMEWYVQDKWKISRRLTLDYGVRFTYDIPAYLETNQGGNFDATVYSRSAMPLLYTPGFNANRQRVAVDPRDGQLYPASYIGLFVPGTGNPTSGAIQAGTPGYARGFLNSNGVLAAPRIGFAYDPFGNGKTAIRAGFGTFINARPRSGQTGDMAFNPPVQLTPTQYYGNVDTFASTSGLLAPTNFTRTVETDAHLVSMYNLTFGIQRTLDKRTMVDVAYSGNMGRHLGQTRQLNVIPYGTRFLSTSIDPTTNTPLPDNFYRPYYGYGNIPYLEFAGTSSYHSLQTQIKRNFSHGLQYGLAWTWSKAMNYGDSYDSGVPAYLSPHFWSYGPAGYDRTHSVVANWVWDTPKVSRVFNHAITKWVLDDWQISGIAAFVSGSPRGIGLSLSDGADLTGGGDGTSVVLTGPAILDKGDRTFDRYFNTSVFARPALGTVGSGAAATRYAFRGPGINNFDLTFFKNFPIKERVKIQFRWEMYNAFNHTQFNGVNTTAQFNAAGQQINTQFGQVTSARDPRIQQMSLRLTF